MCNKQKSFILLKKLFIAYFLHYKISPNNVSENTIKGLWLTCRKPQLLYFISSKWAVSLLSDHLFSFAKLHILIINNNARYVNYDKILRNNIFFDMFLGKNTKIYGIAKTNPLLYRSIHSEAKQLLKRTNLKKIRWIIMYVVGRILGSIFKISTFAVHNSYYF